MILTIPITTSATETKQQIIEKVISAYGGKAITSMNSLVVHDKYKMIRPDGGIRPGLDAVTRLNSILTIAFESGKKSVKNWRVNAVGKRLGQIIFDGNNGWSINYLRGSHVLRPDLNHNNVGVGMMRLLDTTVVRSLISDLDTVKFHGKNKLFGREHYQLSFKMNGLSDVTIDVDSITGLISQLALKNGTHYVYSDYRKTDRITYAADTNQFSSGKVVTVTLSREIDANPEISKAFDLPKSTKALEGMQDNSKMVVKQLGNGVYLAGLGNRSSLFVDAGDYFVAVGSLPGFKERLASVNNELGTDKSVKYVVISEHQGHMSGVKEIAALGVSFVANESHLPIIKKQIKAPISNERFVLVEDKLDLANGKVHVYDISTVTSEHFLLFYVPALRLAYSMDEFGTNLLNSVPSPDKRMISFRSAIEALNVKIERFAYVHGTGILSLEQLRQVTDSYKDVECPVGEDVCGD